MTVDLNIPIQTFYEKQKMISHRREIINNSNLSECRAFWEFVLLDAEFSVAVSDWYKECAKEVCKSDAKIILDSLRC